MSTKRSGSYWPDLDEDLILECFLRDELKKVVNDNPGIKAA